MIGFSNLKISSRRTRNFICIYFHRDVIQHDNMVTSSSVHNIHVVSYTHDLKHDVPQVYIVTCYNNDLSLFFSNFEKTKEDYLYSLIVCSLYVYRESVCQMHCG